MKEEDLSHLEQSIRHIPGVLGCVVLAHPDGSAAEIQAFARAGADTDGIQRAIVAQAQGRDVGDSLGQVFVFELDADSGFGDRDSLLRAAELAEQEARSKGPLTMLQALGTLHSLAEDGPDAAEGTARPPLRRVIVSSSTWRSEAEVTLGRAGEEYQGRAEGDKSQHGLEVVARATLEAAVQVVPHRSYALRGVTLTQAFEQPAVLVLVAEQGGTRCSAAHWCAIRP